jgi:hypothetical protein
MQALGYRVVQREEAFIPGISGDTPNYGGPVRAAASLEAGRSPTREAHSNS